MPRQVEGQSEERELGRTRPGPGKSAAEPAAAETRGQRSTKAAQRGGSSYCRG